MSDVHGWPPPPPPSQSDISSNCAPYTADTLPLITFLLFLFHLMWFIPYATGALQLVGLIKALQRRFSPPADPSRSSAPPPAGSWSIESTGLRFDCSQGALLRMANYGLFSLFGLCAIVEAVLTVVGLQGGSCSYEVPA